MTWIFGRIASVFCGVCIKDICLHCSERCVWQQNCWKMEETERTV